MNTLIVRVLIEAGLLFAARERVPSWLVTFTSATGAASLSEYERSFRRMSARTPSVGDALRRGVRVVGLHQSGAPHFHAVVIASQASEAALKRAASDAGLGRTHIEPIGCAARDARCVAAYVARELPLVASMPTATRPRRMANFSRQWPAGGITEGRDLVFEVLREQRDASASI